MAQKIPIYIPTYISSINYNPATVLPRLYFYNGPVECEKYYVYEGASSNGVEAFPYFDHYNVVSGSFPTTDSLSLLMNNEAPVYGEQPTNNLYTTYWDKYISLLYNPKTRVIYADAIIPLSEYFDVELNDIVNFRGNYYHLRAINDYNLRTGECKLQLLGPIIADTFGGVPYTPPTTTTTTTTAAPTTTTTSTTTTTTTTAAPTTATLNWGFSKTAPVGTMDIYVNGSIVESRNSSSTGTWTGLVLGDQIYVEINVSSCTEAGSTIANAYTSGIIADASCGTTVTGLTTYTYTVTSGDIGTTLNLNSYASCDAGCL